VRPLVELRHHDGELLRARDLAAEVTAEAARRALHVRAVHGTWGVALGFAIKPTNGDHAIAVGPGFGYDCRGRAVASAERVIVPAPSTDDPADLVVSQGQCGLRLDWRAPGRACDEEMVLARAGFKNGRLAELDESVRQWCRARRFHVASGIADKQIAANITVSTAAATFDTTPRYFATLEASLDAAATLEIDREKPGSFRLQLRAPHEQIRQAEKRKVKVRVHWVGVEALPMCGLDGGVP
jgi:hypothetical protein